MHETEVTNWQEHEAFCPAPEGSDKPGMLRVAHCGGVEEVSEAAAEERAKKAASEGRLLDSIISDESRDRYNSEVRGWRLKNFQKNPVTQFGHDYYIPPIGRCVRAGVNKAKQLMARTEFTPPDINEFGYSIGRMYASGYMNAFSVGFVPKSDKWVEQKESDKKGFWELKNNDLLEYSAVPVPANPNCVALAQRDGLLHDGMEKAFVVNRIGEMAKTGHLGAYDLNVLRSATGEWLAREIGCEVLDHWQYDENEQCHGCGTRNDSEHDFNCPDAEIRREGSGRNVPVESEEQRIVDDLMRRKQTEQAEDLTRKDADKVPVVSEWTSASNDLSKGGMLVKSGGQALPRAAEKLPRISPLKMTEDELKPIVRDARFQSGPLGYWAILAESLGVECGEHDAEAVIRSRIALADASLRVEDQLRQIGAATGRVWDGSQAWLDETVTMLARAFAYEIEGRAGAAISKKNRKAITEATDMILKGAELIANIIEGVKDTDTDKSEETETDGRAPDDTATITKDEIESAVSGLSQSKVLAHILGLENDEPTDTKESEETQQAAELLAGFLRKASDDGSAE